MWHRTSHRLQAQGINPEQYLQMTGKTEEELVVESEADAETALKREAVLAAIVEAEGIEVSDEEVEQALRASAPPDAGEKQLKRALKRARSRAPTRRSARTSQCARRWTWWLRAQSPR